MRKDVTIGLVVPFATDTVPEEGLKMYPDVRFVARGVGVQSLTPRGYDSAWEGIIPAAEQLAARGVDAIMVIGTSLTFYRGAEVHARLKAFLRAHGFDVLALKGFGLLGFNQPDTMREADIIALGSEVCAEARAAEGLLISCGGLRTLGVAKPLEARHGIPVVASTQAAFWAALRLVGESGHVAGRGRLLEQTPAALCIETISA